MANNRVCLCCGNAYEYCGSCRNGVNLPAWKNLFDNENCKDNMCDFIMFEDDSRTLYCLELKSTKSTSVSLSMIRDNQIEELTKASKHNLVAGFLINFRNTSNDTYFIEICDFNKMISEVNKKSFNKKDLMNYNAIYVESERKKVNYKYNVKKFITDTHL